MSREISKNGRSGGGAGNEGRTIRLLLGLIFLLFIGILVMVAIISKRANPVMLDENGRPLSWRINADRPFRG